MIVAARRSAPRFSNYRRRGVWSGLGVLNYYDLLAQANLQDCSPMDSACVTNNVAKQAAVEDLWSQYRVTGAPDDTVLTFKPLTAAQVAENYNPADVAHGGNVIDTRGIMTVTGGSSANPAGGSSSGSGGSSAARGGQVSFTTSRGGTALQVGDTWTLRITGASPNSVVAVNGGKNGAAVISQMGSTDSSGSFSLSGQITSDQVGSWSEYWTVGGAPSGSFSFTVAPATTPAGQTIINSSGAQNAPSGSSASVPSSGFSMSSIPTWGWVAAGAAALFLFRGSK